jgi:hypothetical protein
MNTTTISHGNRTHFLIWAINFDKTSFKGFSFAGLGALFSTTTSRPLWTIGDWVNDDRGFDFLDPLAASTLFSDGSTSFSPVDVELVGFEYELAVWPL